MTKENAFKGKIIGVILGTLGRQGNPLVHDKVCKFLKSKGFLVVNLMLKEINENLLEDFEFIDAFVQISCPRLSTDWGCNYKKPILNSYEVFNDLNTYELDYYARETKKEWNNY
ncbi:Diphthamide biosynthesis protein 1 [Gurleya vavrai]